MRFFCIQSMRWAMVSLLFACGLRQQCVAAKVRHHYEAGIYLTRDGQLLHALVQHTPGTYWIDGYRMTITQQTQICWHDSALPFSAALNRNGQPIPRLQSTSPCKFALAGELGKVMWLQYRGTDDVRFFRSSMKVVATRIDVWESEDVEDVAGGSTTKADWQSLCAMASPHELRYPNEGPIDVVCDAKANRYIESVFSALLKNKSDGSTAGLEMPKFYIVRPFQVSHNYYYEAIDGTVADCLDGGSCTYRKPRAHSTVREIVYAPDGSVLIPDTALASLKNESQLAALLSYSLVVTDQHLAEHLFHVQHFKARIWSLNYKASGRENSNGTGGFISDMNTQVLRLGIRQMYLARYDIRYAPLAWAVEQGKHIKGSLIVPDYRHLSWYATYAFNVISQLYPDVDYGKLKKGEAEYAQFLDELRRADPEAFAAK